MKVYVTKYPGVIREVEVDPTALTTKGGVRIGKVYIYKPDWHETLAVAQEHLRGRLLAEQTSLEAKLADVHKRLAVATPVVDGMPEK